MRVVRMNARVSETVLDIEVMAALRRKVGGAAFDEIFEDALCDVTERLSVIERAMARGDQRGTSAEALALSAVATRLGLRSVGAVTKTLHTCCEAGNIVAAGAVAARLSRLGDRCVLAAAEMSVDLGATAK
jgi:hypothetical protein